MKKFLTLLILILSTNVFSQEDEYVDDEPSSVSNSPSIWSRSSNSNNSQGGTKDNGQGNQNGTGNGGNGNHYGWEDNQPAAPITSWYYIPMGVGLMYGLYSMKRVKN